VKHILDALGKEISSTAEKKTWDERVEGFCSLYDRFLKNRTNVVDWDLIKNSAPEYTIPYSSLLKPTNESIKELANKLVVIKLNGGLGTSMGCKGPKSCIQVREHQTFLDLTVLQIRSLNQINGSKIPLVLMNSFNTHADTINLVRKYQDVEVKIESFNQSQFPRISADSLLPLLTNHIGLHHQWYPPGHGDIYQSLKNSGLLDKFIEEGKEWIFISNIDNLGATVDFNILAHAVKEKKDFLMEVTYKTRADIKGGTLIQYGETPLKLLEIAQVPKNHVPDFTSIKKFKVFNTNNLWVNLKSLRDLLESPNALNDLDIICNPKTEQGQRIIQLETAAGAAIGSFKHPQAINVPRRRFLPVKSTSDLFVLQSDLFTMDKGAFKMSPLRPFLNPPMVKLGSYFKDVSEYMKRLGGNTNIIDLDQLTISGDVFIGRGVVLKGTVIIVAQDGCRIDIPDGSILEDKVVTGSLRILDH